MIQTLLLFKCKLLCYHANLILVSITTRSPSASLQVKGLATKYTTVKGIARNIYHAEYRCMYYTYQLNWSPFCQNMKSSFDKSCFDIPSCYTCDLDMYFLNGTLSCPSCKNIAHISGEIRHIRYVRYSLSTLIPQLPCVFQPFLRPSRWITDLIIPFHFSLVWRQLPLPSFIPI